MPQAPLLADVVYSLARGLRDTVRPAMLRFSILVWLAACGCALVVLAVGWPWIIDGVRALVLLGWEPLVRWLPFMEPAGYVLVPLAGVLIVLLGLVSLTLILTRLLLEIWLMDRVRSVLLKDYPDLVPRNAGFVIQLRLFLGQLFWLLVFAPVLLVLPLVGGPLWFALAAWMTTRGLMVDALDGVADARELAELPRQNRLGLLLLGGLLSPLLLLPFINMLTPVLLACTVCHFSFRRLQRARASG